METIFTIGHSNHSVDYLLKLFQQLQITCVMDIRSVTDDLSFPEFHQSNLQRALKQHHINYRYLGKEFGGRQTDPALHNREGQVSFLRFQQTSIFHRGIQQVEMATYRGRRVALLCSEADPLKCHRFSLVAAKLAERGHDVQHILADGTLRHHTQLEMDLLMNYWEKLPTYDVMEEVTTEERLWDAYQLHNAEVGWRMEELMAA